MTCPECGSENIGVHDTRSQEDNIWRRRKCFECGHRFSTIEIDFDVYEKLMDKPPKDTKAKVNEAVENMKRQLYKALDI